MSEQDRLMIFEASGGQIILHRDLTTYHRLRTRLREEREAVKALILPDRGPAETAREVTCALEELSARRRQMLPDTPSAWTAQDLAARCPGYQALMAAAARNAPAWTPEQGPASPFLSEARGSVDRIFTWLLTDLCRALQEHHLLDLRCLEGIDEAWATQLIRELPDAVDKESLLERAVRLCPYDPELYASAYRAGVPPRRWHREILMCFGLTGAVCRSLEQTPPPDGAVCPASALSAVEAFLLGTVDETAVESLRDLSEQARQLETHLRSLRKELDRCRQSQSIWALTGGFFSFCAVLLLVPAIRWHSLPAAALALAVLGFAGTVLLPLFHCQEKRMLLLDRLQDTQAQLDEARRTLEP